MTYREAGSGSWPVATDGATPPPAAPVPGATGLTPLGAGDALGGDKTLSVALLFAGLAVLGAGSLAALWRGTTARLRAARRLAALACVTAIVVPGLRATYDNMHTHNPLNDGDAFDDQRRLRRPPVIAAWLRHNPH
jgi:hypothetical protein